MSAQSEPVNELTLEYLDHWRLELGLANHGRKQQAIAALRKLVVHLH